ncbi:MAG: nicotinate-nucleotide adenylyltransferase [Lachnospiraceae bacterium]|jgi:nicotinate-nucleotide adenylyltransferase|nr:nicotinate-nucleotide adenylyltransferase [Lachnospiraceae bacterium]
MNQIKRIGIMGGTFNPIHQGHLLLAEQAREYCELDEVLFIPSGNSYMKDSSEILDGEIRIFMTAAAIEDNPSFTLSTMEMEREGATYTCDTIQDLREKEPFAQYYFIMGADSLFSMESWKDPGEIFKNCILVAAARDSRDTFSLTEKATELQAKYQARIIILPERKIDISSSEVRSRIREGKSVRYMIPDKVIDYISSNHLYCGG